MGIADMFLLDTKKVTSDVDDHVDRGMTTLFPWGLHTHKKAFMNQLHLGICLVERTALDHKAQIGAGEKDCTQRM